MSAGPHSLRTDGKWRARSATAEYTGDERRKRRKDRRGGWLCAKCYGAENIIKGSSAIGVRIRKCARCGMMDRRAVDLRRAPWEAAGLGIRHYVLLGALAIVVALLVTWAALS